MYIQRIETTVNETTCGAKNEILKNVFPGLFLLTIKANPKAAPT